MLKKDRYLGFLFAVSNIVRNFATEIKTKKLHGIERLFYQAGTVGKVC